MTNIPRILSGLVFMALAIVLGHNPANARDARAIYDDTCVRCHGLLDEQSSWQRFAPTGDQHVQLAVVLPQGPTLNGVFGRPVGIIEGYKYSKGMRRFAETGAVWDRETLDKFLTNSRKFVKGTFMILKLKDDERTLMLEYLETVSRYQP